MKKQWIILLMMLMVLMLAGCGKEEARETETSSAEPPAVPAELSEETDGSAARYENMYFSLDLPSEDLQVTEERSSEYYLVTVSEKSGTALMEIELSARSRELTEDQFYYGELFIPGDQGHLNILVTRGSGASEERIDGILETMEPCGEFAIKTE